MKILSSAQMREADSFTILNEPVSSINLMERAARACSDWIINNNQLSKDFLVVCGNGNNGGDGLAIARMLSKENIHVNVIICYTSKNNSEEFNINLKRLSDYGINHLVFDNNSSVTFSQTSVIVDALFGSGLSRVISGEASELIKLINNSGRKVISIDLPSGLFADKHSEGTIVNADHTLTFQSPKLGLLFPENGNHTGEIHVLDIKLNSDFIESSVSDSYFFLKSDAKHILKQRNKFSHKGTYGHSFLISGSKGKAGAAVLAARACLRTGTGLLTVLAPESCREILQVAIPEAMVISDVNENYITNISSGNKYEATGVGPGIGQEKETAIAFFNLFRENNKPMVIDADALNLLSSNPEWLKNVPENSVLTPHPKEFERLAGISENDFNRFESQKKFSKKYKVIIVLKGAHTCITTPGGKAYFNSTGNPGMAKGGTGDALTGIILALLAQKYSPLESALLGVYLHGLAGDYAARKKGIYSMLATDLIESIPEAFNYLIIED